MSQENNQDFNINDDEFYAEHEFEHNDDSTDFDKKIRKDTVTVERDVDGTFKVSRDRKELPEFPDLLGDDWDEADLIWNDPEYHRRRNMTLDEIEEERAALEANKKKINFNDETKINKKIQGLVAELNEQQAAAAVDTEGPVMVIAGAGAGKTKTLITRVAVLLAKGVEPANILIVTFTKKAAGEIKERLIGMPGIGEIGESVAAGTFHSTVFQKFLKPNLSCDYLQSIGIDSERLDIATDDESSSLFKRAVEELDMETRRTIAENAGELTDFYDKWLKTINEQRDDLINKGLSTADIDIKLVNVTRQRAASLNNKEGNKKKNGWDTKDFMSSLSLIRAEGLDYKQFSKSFDPTAKDAVFNDILCKVWKKYTELCRKNFKIDYDDILVVAKNMLSAEPHIARDLAKQFKYVHLDEYQDTNQVQMDLMNFIVEEHKALYGQSNLFCVGDEKQSIYGFRGSKIEIILGMPARYSDLKTYEINYNYRSSSSILSYANDVADMMPDKLTEGRLSAKSEMKEIEPVIVEFASDKEEAHSIVASIKRDINAGANPGDFAILYRNRNLKTEIETLLAQERLDYNLVGDTSIYKKAETRNALAMIKFVTHTWDSTAGLRLMKAFSGLGVGANAAEKALNERGINVFDFLLEASEKRLTLKKKNELEYPLTAAAKKVRPFIGMIKNISESIVEEEDSRSIKAKITTFWNIYLRPKNGKKDKGSENEKKLSDNVEFMIDRFCDELAAGKSADEALEDISLMLDKHEDGDNNKIQMMTVHASKGLEFPVVYYVGFEANPNAKYEENPKELKEETRLAYVGLTRAVGKLVMTYAKRRLVNGEYQERQPHHVVEGLIEKGRKVVKMPPKLRQENNYQKGKGGYKKSWGNGSSGWNR